MKALAPLILATLILLGAAPAAVAGQLIEGRDTTVSFQVPAPGKSQQWPMRVRNTSDLPVSLALGLHSARGSALHGDAQLRLTLRTEEGSLLARGTAEELLDRPITLFPLQSGQSRTVQVTTHLPAEADNTYQGTDAVLEFSFWATQPVHDTSELPHPGTAPHAPPEQGVRHLAATGLARSWLIIAGTVILVLGAALRGRAINGNRKHHE
ncbi:hypothetical protein [Glutamicibacter endophyticus]|uniref:hypothetical protein n=1 Tax=Glutamicibacter endophyticus TaxID=1522174 RepID=UPI003AF05164